MSKYKDDNTRKIFFTDVLKKKMEQFSEYPCTLVEAPVGYGKTTMVSEAVDKMDALVIWQKIYDRNAAEFWAGFLQAISVIDVECAQGLRNIRMLEDSLMKRECLLLLENLKVQRTTFIIMDDYHYIKSDAADEFLKLIIMNMPVNLHLIIISRRSFPKNIIEMKLRGLINYIDKKDLALSQSDINNYYLLFGIHLEKEELEKLYFYSEGWISALYLFALDYKLHGHFVFTRSVSELVYQAVYDPLDDELRDFLMRVCHFDSFNLEQASYVWQKDNAELLLDRLMSWNAFISKDKLTGYYSLHNIFTICLLEKFKLFPEELQRSIWKRIGEVYFNNKLYMDAMEYFYNAKYYEGVMKSMEGGDKARSIHNEHKDKFVKFYNSSPMEAKIKHPLAILFFALECITQFREHDLFIQACNDFHISMEQNDTLNKDEREQLLGEYEVLQSFYVYNDIIKMGECNQKAFKLLKGPTRFINTKDSFTFSSPSLLYLYYREPGKLEEMIEYIKNALPYYSNNTKGHGDSYRPVLEAEWQYYKGNLEEAMNTVLKAIPMAKATGQVDIELCGMFLLAKISLYQGEFAKVIDLFEQMEALVRYEVKNYQTYWLVYTLDLCKAYIYSSLEQMEQVPQWIFEYEYPKHLNFMSISYANMIYGKALLLKDCNMELLGLSEQFKKQASIFPNLLAIIYVDIYEAIANFRISRMEECIIALKKALDAALPDGVTIPFVEHTKTLLPLFDTLKDEEKYTAFINTVILLYKKYIPTVQKIIEDNFMLKRPQLSKREKQIALLVMDGLNNKEIAEVLFISPNTVKQELKIIFKKLGINSRVLLKIEMVDS